MGCVVSTSKDGGGNRWRLGKLGEVAVFVPGLRIPRTVDFNLPLGNRLSKRLEDQLSALRTRVVIASEEAPAAMKPRRRTATRHGGSSLSDLRESLEEYLPILLGLVKEGTQLKDAVQFEWTNQEDVAEETNIADAWYEILSVLHLMALLCFSEANLLLLPRSTVDGYQPSISEGSKRAAIDVLLKGAGYLDCAIRNVLPQIPPSTREKLPVDLREEVLQALCLQALGQGVDIQLGMAIDSPKATLAVKRRLACEMVKCWNQADENISRISFTDGWGEKHRLFVKWKAIEAKAAAYYYHGLILGEGNTEKSHDMAVAALQAAEELLKESKKAGEAFHVTAPTSRSPPLSGSMKYLHEKIPKEALNKAPLNLDLHSREKILERAPALPDFALALKPDDYQLPPLHLLWEHEKGAK